MAFETTMLDYRKKLVALRQEKAATAKLLSVRQILAEWKPSEEFIWALKCGLSNRSGNKRSVSTFDR
jgi:hypothetical protein